MKNNKLENSTEGDGVEKNPKISVVIRTRNEERFIGFAIQSVIDVIPETFEIIIVDNNSTDETLAIVDSFKPFHDIKVRQLEGKYSPGYALNYGVRESSGEYILILSAHCELTYFSNTLFSFFQEPKCCVLFGKQTPVFKGKKITPRYVWANFLSSQNKNLYSEEEQRYFLHNACAFYKKDTLLMYGFPGEYPSKEDRYWISNMIGEGYHSWYVPDLLECKHHWTPNGATWKGIG